LSEYSRWKVLLRSILRRAFGRESRAAEARTRLLTELIIVIPAGLAFVGVQCGVLRRVPFKMGPRPGFKSPLGCEMRAKQRTNLLETSIICVKSSINLLLTYIV